MSGRVDLRAVLDLAEARNPDPEESPLASANSAVPLLWLSLFDYEEVRVERLDDRPVFFAAAPLAKAVARVSALPAHLPADARLLAAGARTLEGALQPRLEDTPSAHVVLYPAELFRQLPRAAARPYLTQLTQLCDMWSRLGKDLDFKQVSEHLRRISPDIAAALSRGEGRTLRYYLLGDLADRAQSLDDFLVKEGQREKDVEPQALAVGEQGLVLGRFEGTWRLISSGTREDLRGVWAEGDAGFLVGRRGTICALKKGRVRPISNVPTEMALNAVWGISAKSVIAVGDHGTVLAFAGDSWQPWPVGTDVHLSCVWAGSAENVCIAGQDSAVYRFDGFGWGRLALPIEAAIKVMVGDEERVLALGGSRAGGELFELTREGWLRDHALPRGDWLEGGWKGWERDVGAVPAGGGVALVNEAGAWHDEALQLEHVFAVAGGEQVYAAGTIGGYTAICHRGLDGWSIEATLQGLRVHALWAAGNAKPPQLPAAAPPPSAPADEPANA
ncbi:MAG: hypothetical protein KC503_37265 [Myxococcales bacterium]|nr:hypothetical protein [Myxococcales bacterium]